MEKHAKIEKMGWGEERFNTKVCLSPSNLSKQLKRLDKHEAKKNNKQQLRALCVSAR